MSEPRPVEQPRHPSDTAQRDRDRVIAKIERGLADVKSGRVVSHAEVLTRIDARYPAAK